MSRSKRALIKSTINLSDSLRQLGLNLNASKTKLVQDNEIDMEFSEEDDFFNALSYFNFAHLNDLSLGTVKDRYKRMIHEYQKTKKINLRVFRTCLHNFESHRCEEGIFFALKMLIIYPEQTIDIVKYLKIFINDKKYIIKFVYYLLNKNLFNVYKWQQVWLLALLIDANDANNIKLDLICDIAYNKNQDELSRSIAFIILTKNTQDMELISLKEYYLTCDETLIKRTLLLCLSKLPQVYINDILRINPDDDINLIITKRYLSNNTVDFNNISLI